MQQRVPHFRRGLTRAEPATSPDRAAPGIGSPPMRRASDGGDGAGREEPLSDQRQRYINVATRRVRIRTDLVCGIDQRLRLFARQAG